MQLKNRNIYLIIKINWINLRWVNPLYNTIKNESFILHDKFTKN